MHSNEEIEHSQTSCRLPDQLDDKCFTVPKVKSEYFFFLSVCTHVAGLLFLLCIKRDDEAELLVMV